MTLAEQKLNIIKKISEMEDSQLLDQLQEWLNFELDDSIYHLSEEQTNRVNEAKEEYNSGKTISEEQANEEIKKWLEEK